jgi:phosphatidylglycerophosphate synthase
VTAPSTPAEPLAAAPPTSSLKPQYGWSVSAMLPFVPATGDFFLRYKVSANTVSWLSLVVFLVGLAGYALYPGSLAVRVMAVLCFAGGTLLDVVDGYVARKSGSSGKFGAYLDAGIDIFRYNLFLLVLLLVRLDGLANLVAVALYAVLLNISFYRVFRNIRLSQKSAPANLALGGVLPKWYRDFCLDKRLLYNPFNLEDQLLLYLFSIGVLFGVEGPALWFCLAARMAEVGVVILTRLRKV